MAESRDRLLSSRYRLMSEIGRGGMGTVWWALDEATQREVAVKEVHLPPSLSARERANLIKRTDREAMATGRLRHPGLIAMLDVVIEDDRPWLVMEYIAARSLEDVLVEDGPISPPRVAEIGRRLLDALGVAHAAGIVHRDVKPSNVLLAASGRVVLTDFGIATYDGATTLTQSGSFMGSPAYVAPEVARGERAAPAADLWSLGATLYAAVEGRPPYDHETAVATLTALVTTEPDPPVHAGPLRPVLDGLLRKDPARRLSPDRAAALLAAAAAAPEPVVSPVGPEAARRTGHAWFTRERARRGRPGEPRRFAGHPGPPAEPLGPARRSAPSPGGDRPRTPSGEVRCAPEGTGAPPDSFGASSGLRTVVSEPAGGRALGAPPRPRPPRRLTDVPGVVPTITGVVLAFAVAAGVLVGLHGRDAPESPEGRRSPAAAGPPAASSPRSSPAPSPAAPVGLLPKRVRDASGGWMSLVAGRGGRWPGTFELSLAVPGRAHRIGVVVVCRTATRGVTFTADSPGHAGAVRGSCAEGGHVPAVARVIQVPGAAGSTRIRVRVRASAAPPNLDWAAGAYQATPP